MKNRKGLLKEIGIGLTGVGLLLAQPFLAQILPVKGLAAQLAAAQTLSVYAQEVRSNSALDGEESREKYETEKLSEEGKQLLADRSAELTAKKAQAAQDRAALNEEAYAVKAKNHAYQAELALLEDQKAEQEEALEEVYRKREVLAVRVEQTAEKLARWQEQLRLWNLNKGSLIEARELFNGQRGSFLQEKLQKLALLEQKGAVLGQKRAQLSARQVSYQMNLDMSNSQSRLEKGLLLREMQDEQMDIKRLEAAMTAKGQELEGAEEELRTQQAALTDTANGLTQWKTVLVEQLRLIRLEEEEAARQKTDYQALEEQAKGRISAAEGRISTLKLDWPAIEEENQKLAAKEAALEKREEKNREEEANLNAWAAIVRKIQG